MPFQETWITLGASFILPKTRKPPLKKPMAASSRSEVGALGFVRQNGLQRDRTSFRGIGGRPQGVDMSRSPNQAPQRVSPKPWATPICQGPPTEVVSVPQGHSIGSYLQSPPVAKAEVVRLTAPAPPSGEGVTLAALAGYSLDAEIKEDLAACKGRLDAVGLRLSGQDNAVKGIEMSLSSLREEYSKISQTTDGQSASKLEACERVLSRLDSAFQEFSTSIQREVRSIENLIAKQAQAASQPVLCKLLEDEGELHALDTLQLFLPLHTNASSDVCLFRRKFNAAKNAIEETDFVVQTAAGDPRVAFL